jgi:hypothetical protein
VKAAWGEDFEGALTDYTGNQTRAFAAIASSSTATPNKEIFNSCHELQRIEQSVDRKTLWIAESRKGAANTESKINMKIIPVSVLASLGGSNGAA